VSQKTRQTSFPNNTVSSTQTVVILLLSWSGTICVQLR